MKKSIVSYNNIKLTKNNIIKPDETSQNDVNTSNKRLIFKTKSTKPVLTESKQTISDNPQSNTKSKIILKRNLNEKKAEKYNFNNNSFDESDEDELNVFDLNKKTSRLSIKKHKNDTSVSSSSASSFSSSFINSDLSPKVTKNSPNNKTKKIDLKLPDGGSDEDEKIIKKIKTENTKSSNVNKKDIKKEKDIETKLKELDDDEDFDKEKIKKFKLIKKKDDTKTESIITNDNLKSNNVIIKNKIFNSKSRLTTDTSKNLKLSAFKLNFNDNDQDLDTIQDEESGSKKTSLVKTTSLQPSSQSNKAEPLPRSNSLNHKLSANDSDTTLMIVNIRNTRKAYECEELGEAQAFQDDFDYLIDGLNSKYKLSQRCLSSIKLAECCQSSEFRMNLRSSFSNDDCYVHRIFNLLNDATKFKSLSLCTSLIMFALTQDKLSVDVDDTTFRLILSFLNNNDKNNLVKDFYDLDYMTKFSYLNDLANKTNSPQSVASGSQSNDIFNEFNSNDANDDCYVYKKIYTKCKKLYDDISSCSSFVDSNLAEDINFNCSLLTLDCLLNMNQNMKKNLILNNFYKTEIREKFVLDKILIRSKLIVKNLARLKEHASFDFVNNDLDDDIKCLFLLNKLKSCVNFLETITQPAKHTNSSSIKTSKLKSIEYLNEDLIEDSNKAKETNTLNQNYLIDLKDNFLIELIKESLKLFYDQVDSLIVANSSPNKCESKETNSKLIGAFVNTLKEYLLFIISLTQNNEYTSKKLLTDKEFLDILFEYLLNDTKKRSILFRLSNENDQFDLLIMLLGVLLNLLVNCFKQKALVNLLKYKNKETGLTFTEIILRLYQAKETMVRVAENDQENEFNQLNEQIESQNIENINVALMNSIHKAGKHMEDHIIAAHSGLIIGYMLLNDECLNSKNVIDIKSTKLKLKDNSFNYMSQIIKKFVVFMKMMKVSGFSAEEHVNIVLEFLEQLDN